MRTSCRAILVACTLMLGLALPQGVTTAETLPHHVVAYRGDAVPSQGGFISTLNNPVTQSPGQVFFSASIQDGSGFLLGDGIFRADTQTLDLLAFEGEPSPDGNGNLGPMNGLTPYVNSNNEVAFVNSQTNTFGGFIDSHTILRGRGGNETLEVVFRSNQLLPDDSGERFTASPPVLIGLNKASQVSFFSSTTVDDLGIWRRDKHSSTLVKIVQTGDRTPANDGFMGGGFGFGIGAAMNNKGEVSFADLVVLDANGVREGVYRGGGPGALVRIAREGDPVPAGDGFFADFLWSDGLPINDLGAVAFIALLSGTPGGLADNVAIFRGDGSEVSELARKGDAVPDGNGSFLFNVAGSPVILNNKGEVLFATSVTGAVNGANLGLFLASNNEVQQIARLNAPAPGGGVFSFFGTLMALNNLSQVVFAAVVSEGVSSSFKALFIYEAGELRRLVRQGDTLPGFGIISDLVTSSGVVDGLRPERSLLNDSGQITYDFFANGNKGAALAEFPCIATDNLELFGFNVVGTESYRACSQISVDSVTVQAGGELTLRAGDRVALADGFRILNGGKFVVSIDKP